MYVHWLVCWLNDSAKCTVQRWRYVVYICFHFVLLVLTFEAARFTLIVCSPLRWNCRIKNCFALLQFGVPRKTGTATNYGVFKQLVRSFITRLVTFTVKHCDMLSDLYFFFFCVQNLNFCRYFFLLNLPIVWNPVSEDNLFRHKCVRGRKST